MPPRRDPGQQATDPPDPIAQLLERMNTLMITNEEIKASMDNLRTRIITMESRTPQSVHQASVEPPDSQLDPPVQPITQQAIATPQSEDKR